MGLLGVPRTLLAQRRHHRDQPLELGERAIRAPSLIGRGRGRRCDRLGAASRLVVDDRLLGRIEHPEPGLRVDVCLGTAFRYASAAELARHQLLIGEVVGDRLRVRHVEQSGEVAALDHGVPLGCR